MHTAVVAGVGPGPGASIARRFDAEGCALGLLARSPSTVEPLADDLDDAVAVTVDIGESGDAAAAFETVRAAHAPVDTLAVNASTASWEGTLAVDPAESDAALATNVRDALAADTLSIQPVRHRLRSVTASKKSGRRSVSPRR